MLTRTLRNLESARLITRQAKNSKAVAVEYCLTELETTFIDPLDSMCRWAKQHGNAVTADVRFLETASTRAERS
jgi:DNA-binding HxlR family transcriptional regulator